MACIATEKEEERVTDLDDSTAMAELLEPPLALATGAVLGAVAFLLCALLFGFAVGIAIAGCAMLIAFLRRAPVAAVSFSVAAVFAAGGLVRWPAALFLSSAAFGVALALYARARLQERLAAERAKSATA